MSEKVETIKAMIDKCFEQKKAINDMMNTITYEECLKVIEYLETKNTGLEDEEDFAYDTH